MQPHRRSYSKSFKAQIVQECVQPGASIATVALSHSLNANLVHRIWIHPFTNGNGRTGRLFTDQYLQLGGLRGCDLWSVNRGFGRDVDAYDAALRAADRVPKGDLDGRAELPESGLLEFTEYFIAMALEQLRFVRTLLEPRTLHSRIDHYFQMRYHSALPTGKGNELPMLRIEALHTYRELLELGPMHHSEMQVRLGLGENAARDLFAQMAIEHLIAIDKNGQVSLRLSGHAIMTLFPDLF